MTLTYPRQKTIKRLLAVYGNQCFFSDCNKPLVDDKSGKVMGKICHIKGNKPRAARYDDNQSDEERHGFDNLILMCPIHHDIIDSDPDLYTVSKLKELKAEHEKNNAEGIEPSDQIVDQFIFNLTQGSIISTTDQKGGQVAHSIININYRDETDLEKSQDKEIIRFLATCLNRPAFQDPFQMERSYLDFDKAIEDTITAFNTGTLYSRNGKKVASSKGMSYLSNKDLKEKIENIVDILRDIRDVFASDVKSCRRETIRREQGLMVWFDSKRKDLLNIFQIVCEQTEVNWNPKFPRERFSREF